MSFLWKTMVQIDPGLHINMSKYGLISCTDFNRNLTTCCVLYLSKQKYGFWRGYMVFVLYICYDFFNMGKRIPCDNKNYKEKNNNDNDNTKNYNHNYNDNDNDKKL